MLKVSTRITSNTLSADLRRKLKLARDLRPVLQAGAQVIVEDTKRAFRQASLRPRSWAPLKAATIRQKQRKGQSTAKLIRDAQLIRSPRILFVDGRRAVMGSNVADKKGRGYAAHHQYGTKHIPARPFWPFLGRRITAGAKRKVETAMKRRLRAQGL